MHGMRLNRYLARAGVASRRASDELIKAGRVTVNGQRGELNTFVASRDVVEVDGDRVGKQELAHVLLNKPLGVVTTASDPEGRPTVVDLVGHDARVVPGRPARHRHERRAAAHERRRPRPPAGASALRRREDLRRRRRGRPDARLPCRRSRTASSSRTASRRRPARGSSAARGWSSCSTRAATARCGGCARRSGTRSCGCGARATPGSTRTGSRSAARAPLSRDEVAALRRARRARGG